MTFRPFAFAASLAAAAALGTGLLAASAPAPLKAAGGDFHRDVEPVLRASCYGCHGPSQQMGNLRVDTREALAAGSGGKLVVPGKSGESVLVRRVLGLDGKPRMPMGMAPLSDEQVAGIRAWIDAGAPWPSEGSAPKHWAYEKPRRAPLPKVRNASWVRNPIDAFVLARLETEGLRPSPEASREKLLRRVSLDLIGLPPSVEELDAFLADRSPDAYERAVDRLLASPHYGERWARPWLDLARYADTNGFEKDARRSIWRYRDWVIDALNRDLPYDQFTIEQIAGDLLPGATLDQRIATGFHRNTMFNEEGGVDQEEQRWLTLVDRVGTTGAVWLGSTVACAQCHDHKYDPISQREFYELLAFFDNCEEPKLELPTPEQEREQKSLRAELESVSEKLKASEGLAPEEAKGLKDRQAELERKLRELPIVTTLVLREREGTGVPSTYIREKGSFLQKGELVQAGVPAVFGPMPEGSPQNRLGLARWLVSPENPLTARVAVNRLWEQLFGRGLVETSDDFGTQGTPPTHPELLDWLATELVRLRWSQKALLRLIVTSATYRQSSRATPEPRERDPDNRLLARGPRFRLEAEMVRDVGLAASGLLSRKIGGPSVFPPQPEGIWVIPYNADQWVTSQGEDRYRRGIYTFWRRTSPYPAFVTFDATSREFCTVKRVRTNTPLQALTTLNDPAHFEMAQALARRMATEGGPGTPSRLRHGFRLCTSRAPSPEETARLLSLYLEELEALRGRPEDAAKLAGRVPEGARPEEMAALTLAANVLLNLDETLTKG